MTRMAVMVVACLSCLGGIAGAIFLHNLLWIGFGVAALLQGGLLLIFIDIADAVLGLAEREEDQPE